MENNPNNPNPQSKGVKKFDNAGSANNLGVKSKKLQFTSLIKQKPQAGDTDKTPVKLTPNEQEELFKRWYC